MTQNLAIFSAISQAKSVDFYDHFFKSRFFRSFTSENCRFLALFFGRSAGPGRVGSGRVVSGHVGVALKSNNALRISTFVVIETVI